jgi:hypothetical protein
MIGNHAQGAYLIVKEVSLNSIFTLHGIVCESISDLAIVEACQTYEEALAKTLDLEGGPRRGPSRSQTLEACIRDVASQRTAPRPSQLTRYLIFGILLQSHTSHPINWENAFMHAPKVAASTTSKWMPFSPVLQKGPCHHILQYIGN